MIWFLYNILFFVAFLLLTPHFLWRMRRRGGYRSNFGQRFGWYTKEFLARAETHPRIWLHAVSVGEVFVALRFMEEIRQQQPESAYILSVTTSTGHRIAQEKIRDCDLLMYFPIDAPFIVKKVLDTLHPQRIILVECEIWPNLVRLAVDRGIPVSLINGRMSDSSFKGYQKLAWLTRRILPLIRPICMQGERDRDRILALGAAPETTFALGSAKFDVAPSGQVEDWTARQTLEQAGINDGVILLGGSTWPGEENVLTDLYLELRASFPDLRLVLVPRHFERAPEVLSMLERKGLKVLQRSKMKILQREDEDEKGSAVEGNRLPYLKDGNMGPPPAASLDKVLLVDSTGELMQFYQAADVVFVGKSLCVAGGQNPLEPLALGKAAVVGPHMENFRSVMEVLLSDEALIQVQDAEELKEQVRVLLSDSMFREQLGRRGAQSVDGHRGVLGRTASAVLGLRAE